MSGYSKRKQNRHENKLMPSKLDDILLGAMVEDRYIDLAGLHQRIKGTMMPTPHEIKDDLMRWREMRIRHKCSTCGGSNMMCTPQGQPVISQRTGLPKCACGGRGDYRHRGSEMRATRIIAEWTLQVNAALRNQPDPVPMQWGD